MRKHTYIKMTLLSILTAAAFFPTIRTTACLAQAACIYQTADTPNNSISAMDEDPQAYREQIKPENSLQQSSLSIGDSLSGYSHSSKFDAYDIIKGIDISVYQQTINFKKVKQAGIDFAFIRVAYRGYTTGTLVTDPLYETNLKQAQAAGIDVGVYIYSQAITPAEAVEEARYAVSLVQDYDLELPIVLDYEYASTSSGLGGRLYQAKLSKSKATSVCTAFCEAVEALGYTAAVYANRSMLEAQLHAGSISSQYPVWLANYVSKTGYKGDYSYWQYTSTGSVKGITGHVDRNFRYLIQPDVPNAFTATATTYTTTSLTWDKIPGVYGYTIRRSDDMGATYQTIETIRGAAQTSYMDETLSPGRTYLYQIDAFYKLHDGNLTSESDTAITVSTPALQPNQMTAADIRDTAVTLHWCDTANCAGYTIYRSTDALHYESVATLPAGTVRFTDTALSAQTPYYYQLATKTYCTDGSLSETAPDARMTLAIRTACLPPSAIRICSYTKDSISLSWSACPGAECYLIRSYDALTDCYSVLATVPAPTTDYTLSGLAAGTVYTLDVVCGTTCLSQLVTGPSGTPITAATKAAAPTSLHIRTGTTSKLKLSWDAQPAADGYLIYRYDRDTDTFERIRTITASDKTSYTDTKLSAATGYIYRIQSYQTLSSGTYYGQMSKSVYGACAPKKVTGCKATAKKTTVKLTWKKSKGATGYLVYRYDKKKKTYKKIKTLKTNSYTDKKRSRHTTYQYKIVPYKTYHNTKFAGTAVKLTAKTK